MSRFLLLFNFLGFCFILVASENGIIANWPVVLSVLLLAVYLSIITFNKKVFSTGTDIGNRIAFIFCLIMWLLAGVWWIAVFMLIVSFIEMIANRKMIVTVSEQQIQVPAFPVRSVNWQELNNLVLKDDLLTIDFKNNKIFQQQIIQSDHPVNEEAFNRYCQSKLEPGNRGN